MAFSKVEILVENVNDNMVNINYEIDLGNKSKISKITFIGNKIFSAIGNIFFRLGIDDILFTYVMGKTRSFQNLQLKNFDFRFCVELPIKAKRNGNKYTNIGSHERKRLKGFKKVSEFKDGFFILIELLRLFLKRKN